MFDSPIGLGRPEPKLIDFTAVGDWSSSPLARSRSCEVFTASYRNETVIVKRPLNLGSPAGTDALREALAAWGGVDHPHVRPLLGFYNAADCPILVLPYLPNGTLKHHISDPSKPRSIEDKLELMGQVASGMMKLHECRIVHGDLRSACVLLDNTNKAVIADSIFARVRHSLAAATTGHEPYEPSSDEISFLAPEILDDELPADISTMADAFAFGTMFYEILNDGKETWVTADGSPMHPAAIRRCVCNGSRPKRPEGIPDPIWALIESCWHQDPTERPSFTNIHSAIVGYIDDAARKQTSGRMTTGLAIGVAAVASALLVPMSAPFIISALGFGAEGVVAGSMAAIIHSWIGNVAAGSMFALLQSAGVIGFSVTANALMAITGAATAGSISAAIASSISSSTGGKSVAECIVDKGPWLVKEDQITDWSPEPIGDLEFGQVYAATYNESRVMVVRFARTLTPNETAELHLEIARWHGFDHPNILSLLGACDTANRPFMIYPLMANGSLKKYISDPEHPRSLEEKLKLLNQVASGMFFLHVIGLVHGNLKADSVLIDDRRCAVVTDFGMLRRLCPWGSSVRIVPGRSAAIPCEYAAPEMLDVRDPRGSTQKTDVYAFGFMLYEVMCDGKSAWTAADSSPMHPVSIRHHAFSGSRPQRPSGIPDPIWQLIGRCWHQDPSQRPKFLEIIKTLELALHADQPALSSAPQVSSTPHADGLSRFTLQCAERGDPDACYSVATILSKDKPSHDPVWNQVTSYLQLSAIGGNTKACNQLSWLYLIGVGLQQDDTEAFDRWRHVQVSPCTNDPTLPPIATFMLGWMTFLGRGTPRDRQKGAELIRQSKAKDFEFGESSLDAQKLVASLSPAACELFKWCKFGSDYDWLCQHLMAICLLGGFGVAKDQIRAVGILHELADEGREISEYWLGQCHKNGWGVVKNAQRAEIWYRRAAQHGNACAQFKLGESLYSGDGGAKNLPEAAEWFTKAAIQGNSDAQWNLGYCYENGLGVDQNSTACMTWYRRAAEQGHIKASTRIGLQTSLSFAWFGQR